MPRCALCSMRHATRNIQLRIVSPTKIVFYIIFCSTNEYKTLVQNPLHHSNILLYYNTIDYFNNYNASFVKCQMYIVFLSKNILILIIISVWSNYTKILLYSLQFFLRVYVCGYMYVMRMCLQVYVFIQNMFIQNIFN